MRKLFLAGVSVLALGVSGAQAQQFFEEQGLIIQDGTNGGAYIDQATNNVGEANAEIEQGQGSLGDNAAIFQQDGGGINATIEQNVTGAGGGNLAGIVQSEGDDLTTAAATQEGNDNTAGIRQRGTNLQGEINQTGDLNKAVVKQGDVPPGFGVLDNATAPGVNFASIDNGAVTPPTGLNFPGSSSPIVFGGQVGAATNSIGTVNQTGDDNRAAVLQAGDGNTGTVDQIGNINDAFVFQSDDGNTANVIQTGELNFALAIQEGTDNEALITQDDVVGDAALVLQPGVDNRAEINQSADGITSGGAVIQAGIGNNALINQ